MLNSPHVFLTWLHICVEIFAFVFCMGALDGPGCIDHIKKALEHLFKSNELDKMPRNSQKG